MDDSTGYTAPEHVPEDQRLEEFGRYINEEAGPKWLAVWEQGKPYPQGCEMEIHRTQEDGTPISNDEKTDHWKNLRQAGHKGKYDPVTRTATGAVVNEDAMYEFARSNPNYDVDALFTDEIGDAIEIVTGVHTDATYMIQQAEDMREEAEAHLPEGVTLDDRAYLPVTGEQTNGARYDLYKLRYNRHGRNAEKPGQDVGDNSRGTADQYNAVFAPFPGKDLDDTVSIVKSGSGHLPSGDTALLPLAAARANSRDDELDENYMRGPRIWKEALGVDSDRYGHQGREPGSIESLGGLAVDKGSLDMIFGVEQLGNVLHAETNEPLTDEYSPEEFNYDPEEPTLYGAFRPSGNRYEPTATFEEFLQEQRLEGMAELGDQKHLVPIVADYTDMDWEEFVYGPATDNWEALNGTTYEHLRVNPFVPASEVRPICHSEEWQENTALMAGYLHNLPEILTSLSEVGVHEEMGPEMEEELEENDIYGEVEGITFTEMNAATKDDYNEGMKQAGVHPELRKDALDLLEEASTEENPLNPSRKQKAKRGSPEIRR